MKKLLFLILTLLIHSDSFSNEFGWTRILSTNTIINFSFNQNGSSEQEHFVLKYNRKFFRYIPASGNFVNIYFGKLDDTYYSGSIGGNPFSGYHFINDYDVSAKDTNFFVFTKNLYTPFTPNDSRIFFSTNGGVSLSNTTYGLNGSFTDVEISNSNDSIIFVVVGKKLYKSVDRGNSIFSVNNSELSKLHIYKYDNRILYSSNNFNILQVSTNGGENFVSTPYHFFNRFVYDNTDSLLYGIVNNQIFITENGIDWNPRSSLLSVLSLEIHHSSNEILYAGTPDGLFKSTDGSNTWELYNNSFSPSKKVINVYSHELLGDTVLVCTEEAVYKVFGSFVVNISQMGNEIPSSFSLSQNFPNPFNPVTKIKFSLPSAQFTKLKVYNSLGQEVTTLVNQHLQPGSYEYTFDGGGLASGVYFYRLEAGDPSASSGQGFVETKRLVLVK